MLGVVEQQQRDADHDGRGQRPDQDGELLLPRRRADEEAGLEVLRGRPAVRRRDADDAGDRQGRQPVLGRRPSRAATKIRQVSSSVATVMPEIGFDDEPISPVSRDETVTNRKPKSTIITAADDPAGGVGRDQVGRGDRGRPGRALPRTTSQQRQVALGPRVAARAAVRRRPPRGRGGRRAIDDRRSAAGPGAC